MATLQDVLDSQDPEISKRLYMTPQYGGAPQPFTPPGSATLADASFGGNTYTDSFSSNQAPGNPPQAQAQPHDVLSSMPKNLADAYTSTLEGMMTGSAFSSQETMNREGFLRGANELRARTAAATPAGAAGQGAAIANKNATESTILGAASQAELENRIAKENLKQQGLGAANTLMTMQEQARQFGITTAEQQREFNETMKLNYNQLSQNQKQFLMNFGLDEAKFNEAKSQFSQTMAETQRMNTAQIEQAQAALAQNKELTMAGIVSGEKLAGMQISANRDIAQMQITSAEKLAADRNWLEQQGINLNKASLEGYTDANGNHVMGSAEIAAQELGLRATTVSDAHTELFGGYDSNGVYRTGHLASMDAETRRLADTLYGYTDDATGMHVMGSLELEADRNAIQRQGMSIEEAQVKGYIDENGVYHAGSLALQAQQAGIVADTLYGYTDANGQHVPGTAELAKSRFGLEADSLELQREELTKKYDLLSAEDKRAADAFYGYDTVGTNGATVHHLGAAEVAEAELAIRKQGLSLEEAQLKGYTDENGNYIRGNIENSAIALDLQGQTVQLQRDEVYGYYNKDGSYVAGKLASMNNEQQMQAKQLYGYTDPETGQHVMGSLELNQKQVTETLENQRTQIMNDIAQTQGVLSMQDRALRIQEASAEADQYWNVSKEFSSYALNHLDAKSTDPQVVSIAAKWYKEQFGVDADTNSQQFKDFAQAELKAAQDSRLTNPIDQSIYAINSSSLDDETKAKMTAIYQQLPTDTKFTQDDEGNWQIEDTTSTWGDLTFDGTNTFPSHPSMFAAAGGVWTGEGQQQFLSDGQKITLDNNFGVQDTNRSIPKGNYTVVNTTIYRNGQANKRTLLQSEDGTKFYATDHYNVDNKAVPMTNYTWHEDGGYYTKE